MDMLAIGGFLVFKSDQSDSIRSLEGSTVYEPD
jgi:hypothetical protein